MQQLFDINNTSLVIARLEEGEAVKALDCGDADLNDFILNESMLYQKEKLAVTYVQEDMNDISHLSKFNTCLWHSAYTKFGGLENLITLSLSLSLSLSGARLDSNTSYFVRGSPALIYGFSCVHAREVGLFFCPRQTIAAGAATDTKKQTFVLILIIKTKCL